MTHKTWLMVFGLTALAALAACSNPTAQKIFSTEVAAPATLVTASEVVDCQLVGEVVGYGEASRSGNAPLARITARDNMLQRAGNMGANYVVLKEYQGNRRAMAIGKAYKCGKP
ncbi:MAG: DUF4156 domain-containing protein [Desulfarculaceae bacterium]|nr:DUF4156 domain-containing protein [Desulfarculaceae bacterium]MCF8046971.1 DUF4156 domain-containing protein [Desulfarculaceae bacterium]MCF8066500.1 DUF4156 domain-containing protein [Desulfarculaceae bacterium]MCF8098085.1 DUF4156 domain-containing protein [Desulfarculaceae bacterium]MCF8123134.1 DUF4156 domain-containing protein [Desulfarculaceae bacterium]